MAIPQGALAAARKYGGLVDQIAAQYRNPVTGGRISGAALLLKLSKGENAFRMGGAPSSAGARGATQFTPGSRQVAINKYGLDPWKDYDQAFHAAALHLLGKINGSTGLHGYNPGMASYPSYILNQRIGKVGGSRTTGSPSRPSSAPSGSQPTASTAPAAPDVQAGGTGLAELLASLQGAQRQPVSSAGIPSPEFSSEKYATGSVGVPSSSGGPRPQIDYGSMIASIQPGQIAGPTPQIQTDAGAGSPSTGTPASPRRSAPGSSGQVVIASGAERAGIGLQKPILSFLHHLAGVSGRPVTVTTGTNHNQYVLGTHTQSDHWTGNAADLGMGGDARQSAAVRRRGDLVAAHAIQIAGGISFKRALAMAQRGGVFNFPTNMGRVQILWKTMTGGNHYNHVHVGVNPGR